ncbi:conserved Plasmodium protein, unknown function [Plasmodium knowlesi strain H]|uniref:Uncharacterized protein n=3 Tax=Plasmodium knowlesi TaxID=5850 RepID=A0A5K1V9D4_PLAKH|nr:conserved Plasmodium protein, unknown function [Plasmodium knowlesi strain H]OTN67178.1 Uncharacterized protein PKNOH_S07449200 [Plasmodium knowlesi]CAA9988619.1 conserved Plasmodium protein, unknown function [Plasmodium knowlesi strain H]SBO21460.1 conserved Plasmodium protein, unknown function [Plasmodium knowlesi strain H]SBO21893.1 conserved Plasmodium protein, unknown function [Plasmodium knowlesi strain H]VVS78093.1 conserved Plasmodium protein, unknown function [Plasmodium knowlesi s|eukprot:XP_002259595.1 hypothetical protein, conserved in Plasmodium species [Plasmodium knowlesi strain H]
MKYRRFNDTYSECSINEQATWSSDETADTTLAKRTHKAVPTKLENEDFGAIHNDIHVKHKREKIHDGLSVLDDFKIIIFGCMGMRTYKMFCCA